MKHASNSRSNPVSASDYAARKPLPYFFQPAESKIIGPNLTSVSLKAGKISGERSENGCGEVKLFTSIKF